MGCCFNPTFSESESKAKEDKIKLIDGVKNNTVMLYEPDRQEDKYRVICAGVWITPSRFLTARHCGEAFIEQDEFSALLGAPVNLKKLMGLVIAYGSYEDDGLTFYLDKGSKPKFAVVVGYDKNDDLLLLESIDESTHTFAKVNQEKVWQGENVFVVGHPLGFTYNFTPGNVAYPEREVDKIFEEELSPHKTPMLQLTSAINPGNSGGGVFDENGNLLGICSFHLTRGIEMSFFVGQNAIYEFLQEEYSLPQSN